MLKLKAVIGKYLAKPKNKKFLERILHANIIPKHYYSPIPYVDELDPNIYTKVNDCPGLEFNVNEYISFMENEASSYLKEYTPLINTGLAMVDAFILYSLIRKCKPRKFIEIGSGESTKIALLALQKNKDEGVNFCMKAIEPYPRKYLKTLDNTSFTLIEKKIQNVDLTEFDDTDILFIDSSHVSKIGSDVNFEMFEIVPRMKVGCLIHWHDIMIPIDYPENWIKSGNMYWNESYVVQSFMMFNKSFRVIWPSKYMQVKAADDLKKSFPFFHPEDPEQQLSSFWIERIA